ncbi:two-component sensor histidine kinase [Psychrosphaera saromensis]|uniref:histidine kinase n=1 Tax=Psychrosphaera saromensis TaxID=716813 RepID=A0A2S7UXV0_9GAMM|nr:HAMP domain-containing sensor histidine kinase [Psychrosphaera saromensis]PQJ54535.1 hypothetical protein BTO11_13345 [Psychrosphaera saromensis]GHB59146.1 two-component sensor histidine kinase [Psychrosphaera saromensis]GLQ14257.1 two-component sensor histidine kinase [Psychrosphaera saromensis]
MNKDKNQLGKNSIKYQLNKHLLFSMLFLVVVFSILIYQIFNISSQATTHRNLMTMSKNFAQQVQRDPKFKLPHRGSYAAFVGLNNIPPLYFDLFELQQLTPFKMLVKEDERVLGQADRTSKYFAFAHPIMDSEQLLYLFYSEDEKTKSELAKNNTAIFNMPYMNVPLSIFGIVILALILFYVVSRQIISLVVKPLDDLAEMASLVDDHDAASFDITNNPSEVGLVAKKLQKSMERIDKFYLREKQFIQNASHELRTPIALVSSALDIIDLRIKQGKNEFDDQYLNIRRANNNMTELSDGLLLLSRENTEDLLNEEVNLKQEITLLVHEHDYLLQGKNVELSLSEDGHNAILLPKILCRILLSNLIRNAFEHCVEGSVFIQIQDACVTVTNSKPPMIVNSRVNVNTNTGNNTAKDIDKIQGFGIGLEIVQQICQLQNWHFQLSDERKDYFLTRITFAEKKS